MAKILVIDDEPEMRAAVREMLTELGHSATEASNGKTGLQAIAADRPDLVICDIFMPEQEGLATIIQLRQTDPMLPMLAITGRDVLYLEAAQKLGATAGLAKPFRIEELQRTVDRLLHAGCPD